MFSPSEERDKSLILNKCASEYRIDFAMLWIFGDNKKNLKKTLSLNAWIDCDQLCMKNIKITEKEEL